MEQSPLSKKLLIKPGCKMVVINSPVTYESQLIPLPKSVTVTRKPALPADFVHLFALNKSQLHHLVPQVLPLTNKTSLFWISYPKTSSNISTDLNRDAVWTEMKTYGFNAVSLVSVDDIWSAMRFKPLTM